MIDFKELDGALMQMKDSIKTLKNSFTKEEWEKAQEYISNYSELVRKGHHTEAEALRKKYIRENG